MALSKVIIHVNATWYPRPEDVMRDANATITAESKTSMFVTAFYGIIDPREYIFTYVNAGHNPPMVVQAGEWSVRELEPTGIALGLLEDAQYCEQTIPIKSGDILVLFTDGVTEATNADDELFSEERLRKIILLNRSLSATELAKVILDNISLFCSGQPQSDDITLFIVKVL